MNEQELKKLFNELRGSFDIEEPSLEHQQRFLVKISTAQEGNEKIINRTKWWKPLSIAASIIILMGVGFGLFQANNNRNNDRIAEISPEIAKSELYFASLIEEQINDLKSSATPETKKMVEDTMLQLDRLEKDYGLLEQDLLQGGNSKLILRAMIINFQTRIDLLMEVMKKIENIKTKKQYDDENYTI